MLRLPQQPGIEPTVRRRDKTACASRRCVPGATGLEVLCPCRRRRSASSILLDRLHLLLHLLLADDRRAARGRDAARRIRVFSRGPTSCGAARRSRPLQIVERLNDLGYSHRAKAEQPGEFTVGRDARGDDPARRRSQGQLVRIVFAARGPKGARADGRSSTSSSPATKKTLDRVTLDAPLITALVTEAREKRRDVPLAVIPPHMVQAVLAIEDRRFYDHPGIDPIGIVERGHRQRRSDGKKYLRERQHRHAAARQEHVPDAGTDAEAQGLRMVHVGRARAAADEGTDPTLYLNDVSLGQRGSFAIHGVPEAARLFFSRTSPTCR